MKNQPLSQRFVWIWFLLTVGMGIAGFYFFTRNSGTPVPTSWGVDSGMRNTPDQWFNALQQHLISPIIIGLLGALILNRRPGHRIGRLLLFLGLVSGMATLMQEWTVYGYFTVEDGLPGTDIAAWVTNWIWVLLFTIVLLTAALFPDGRFVSRGWAWTVVILLGLFTFPALIGGMIETPMSSAFQMVNPFFSSDLAAFYKIVFNSGVIFMPVAALAGFTSAIVRFRQSQAQERQQMKWLMYGVAVTAFLTVVGLGIYFGTGNSIGAIMVNTAVIGPALGVGVALLRHQLYDIDILIRRTLQYTMLTGLLALLYYGSIVVLQTGLRALTGQGNSPLITVMTTLGIAALFNPLRNRVQDFIDRRFYRKKYNAEKALARFAATARDEVEMDKLTTALIEVVNETVQPESVRIWLKGN